jgi:hypothetical protein
MFENVELRGMAGPKEKEVTDGCKNMHMNSFMLWILDKILTNSVEQSPTSEGNESSASQGIPLNLLNSVVNLRIHKHPPTFSILGQSNTVHASQSHSLRSLLVLPYLRLGL